MTNRLHLMLLRINNSLTIISNNSGRTHQIHAVWLMRNTRVLKQEDPGSHQTVELLLLSFMKEPRLKIVSERSSVKTNGLRRSATNLWQRKFILITVADTCHPWYRTINWQSKFRIGGPQCCESGPPKRWWSQVERFNKQSTCKIQLKNVIPISTFRLWLRVKLTKSIYNKRLRSRLKVSGMPRSRNSFQEKIDGTKIRESSVKVYSIRYFRCRNTTNRPNGLSIDGNLCWRSQHELGNHATYI